MTKLLWQLWLWATYLPVLCKSCNGTGICATLLDRQPSLRPHSCCGNCARRRVLAAEVPVGFCAPGETHAIVGSGIMWRRPWSKQQVVRPWSGR